MRNFKLYLLALLFTLIGWAVVRVNKTYAFFLPARLNVHISKNGLLFQRDTVVHLNISTYGYVWLKKVLLDTLELSVKEEDVKFFSSGDSLIVKVMAGSLQKKLDSLLGEGFEIVNASDVFSLKNACILQKKLPIVVSVAEHPLKDCFLCGKVNVHPSYAIVEGKPSIITKLDTLFLKVQPRPSHRCEAEKLMVKLPTRSDIRYHFPSPEVVSVELPFCPYQHVHLERFYRFVYNNEIVEGKAKIEAFAPQFYPLDSIQLVVSFLDEKRAQLKLKHQEIFRQVIIVPDQIELK